MSKQLSCLALAAMLCASAQAGNYPSKRLEMVVPFEPGGTVNLTARLLASSMSEHLGQTVVVQNKPGAGGSIGAGQVAKANPDGYTLLYASMGEQVIQPLLTPRLPYQPTRDFVPVALFAAVPNVLAVTAEAPFSTLEELLDYARANPGRLNMGSAGVGSVNHMLGELFMQQAGVDFTHVPYKGAAPAASDLVAGQVQLLFANLPTVQPYLSSGKVRILGVADAQRLESLPDVPTFAESGVQGVEVDSWSGVVVPTGTPPAVVERLQQAVQAATQASNMRRLLAEQGARPMEGDSAALTDLMRQESQRWQGVVSHAQARGG